MEERKMDERKMDERKREAGRWGQGGGDREGARGSSCE
jgi:hypothetical protein